MKIRPAEPVWRKLCQNPRLRGHSCSQVACRLRQLAPVFLDQSHLEITTAGFHQVEWIIGGARSNLVEDGERLRQDIRRLVGLVSPQIKQRPLPALPR